MLVVRQVLVAAVIVQTIQADKLQHLLLKVLTVVRLLTARIRRAGVAAVLAVLAVRRKTIRLLDVGASAG